MISAAADGGIQNTLNQTGFKHNSSGTFPLKIIGAHLISWQFNVQATEKLFHCNGSRITLLLDQNYTSYTGPSVPEETPGNPFVSSLQAVDRSTQYTTRQECIT